MTNKLPANAGNLESNYPDVWKSYAALGKAVSNSGPMDDRSRRLVKLGLAIGAGSEGAVHSHTRQALKEGISVEVIKQTAILAITTLGFPQAMAAMSWIEDITD